MMQALLPILMLIGSAPAQPEQTRHVRLSLELDQGQLEPGGTVTLAARFEIEKGWHLYWDGQNDTGFPPSLDLTLPAGFTAAEPRWPAPKRHVAPGNILDHIYEDQATILIPITVPADAPAGKQVAFDLKSSWLVCKEACVPERGQARAVIRVRPKDGPAVSPPKSETFSIARSRLPIPYDAKSHALRVAVQGNQLVLSQANAGTIAFFPGNECTPLIEPHRNAAGKGDRLSIPLETEGGRIQGIVEVVMPDTKQPVWYWIDLPPRAGT